ncbi:Hypothetical predicted protein [Marmota monax]|uniref:Uncharacterized protein n=1 Tax=Marmota monax TaxID=9995 RepID=A0A5E4AJD0_MARMO|nr:hypothetical protein GHT09_010552 [Marmota monax]VTJ57325.1 Hypothetical predicted protein [Marmota monax]
MDLKFSDNLCQGGWRRPAGEAASAHSNGSAVSRERELTAATTAAAHLPRWGLRPSLLRVASPPLAPCPLVLLLQKISTLNLHNVFETKSSRF